MVHGGSTYRTHGRFWAPLSEVGTIGILHSERQNVRRFGSLFKTKLLWAVLSVPAGNCVKTVPLLANSSFSPEC